MIVKFLCPTFLPNFVGLFSNTKKAFTMKYLFINFAILLISIQSYGQIKILFDATKAETAGSANWVIDADQNNLNWTKTSTVTTGGSKANAQILPTPDQSTITSSTVETTWTGALSSWGIDCVNKGYHVESLPYNGKITYGDNTNAQDLSNYKVYIITEPNIYFKAAEKTALINFVKNGGGLFIISDHAGADRNNDGSDSPTIWNDLFTNNGIVSNPFGIKFDTTNPNSNKYPGDFSETTTNFTTAANPITKGAYGTATKLKYSNGSSMVLDTFANPTVKGVVFAKESTSKINGAMFVYAKYGKGKIVATGDSSPCDDGTGASGASLYVSYANDPAVANNHRYLFMNATIWLATTDTVVPIKFISNVTKNQNNQTSITWKASQSNGQSVNYEVERSVNGVDFNVVGTITGKNLENSSIENYQWETNETVTTTTYYRIKANENGNISYSQVATLSPNNKQKITIFPNPLSNNSDRKFTISGITNGSVITITDLKGAKYYQNIATGVSISCDLNAVKNKMAAGVYLINIKNGDSIQTEKLMVGK